MFWIMIIVVVTVGVLGDSYSKRLKHKEKVLKIEQDILMKKIELEHIKNETFKLETEKLRLELSDDMKSLPSKTDLLEYQTTQIKTKKD